METQSTETPSNEIPRLLNVEQVGQMLSISISQVWQSVKDEELPKPIKLAAKMTRWKLADIVKVAENPDQYFEYGKASKNTLQPGSRPVAERKSFRK